ncbi:MAG: hypothetical protein DRQ02_09820 [Candidatus Latescibacterota bacterium]|nr:MAG: hypothetical protein DRQ02_09820 [Candidatus Latescibacterota bacterium]
MESPTISGSEDITKTTRLVPIQTPNPPPRKAAAGNPFPKGGDREMRRICLGVTLILGLALSVQASSLPVLELEPGTNQISILVVNQRKTALDSVDVAVNSDLPGWLKITGTTPVDVPAGAEQKLSLNLQVGEVTPGTSGELPLVLKNRTGHSWQVKALVKVVPPSRYELLPNFPNPFNPATTIAFSIPGTSRQAAQPSAGQATVRCRLLIYNLLGQKVKTLVSETKAPGRYKVQWDGTDEGGHRVASGVYFYRLIAGDFIKTRKMLLLQ